MSGKGLGHGIAAVFLLNAKVKLVRFGNVRRFYTRNDMNIHEYRHGNTLS